MRILMLGNSFTFVNNMPEILAQLTGAEVVHHTRGGDHCSGDPGGLGAEKKRTGVRLITNLRIVSFPSSQWCRQFWSRRWCNCCRRLFC